MWRTRVYTEIIGEREPVVFLFLFFLFPGWRCCSRRVLSASGWSKWKVGLHHEQLASPPVSMGLCLMKIVEIEDEIEGVTNYCMVFCCVCQCSDLSHTLSHHLKKNLSEHTMWNSPSGDRLSHCCDCSADTNMLSAADVWESCWPRIPVPCLLRETHRLSRRMWETIFTFPFLWG